MHGRRWLSYVRTRVMPLHFRSAQLAVGYVFYLLHQIHIEMTDAHLDFLKRSTVIPSVHHLQACLDGNIKAPVGCLERGDNGKLLYVKALLKGTCSSRG